MTNKEFIDRQKLHISNLERELQQVRDSLPSLSSAISPACTVINSDTCRNAQRAYSLALGNSNTLSNTINSAKAQVARVSTYPPDDEYGTTNSTRSNPLGDQGGGTNWWAWVLGGTALALIIAAIVYAARRNRNKK